MTDDYLFKHYIDNNYEYIRQHIIAFCMDQHYKWEEDIFHDTLLKCIDLVERNGLKDSSDQGIMNYIFKAYKFNTMRERQYCRVTKRDNNVTDINGAYEDYLSNSLNAEDKVTGDLYTDFSAMYLAAAAEDAMMNGALTPEEYHLWRFKTFMPSLTYNALEQMTKSKGVRNKVKKVRQWLKDHVTMDDINKNFNKLYV